MIIIRIPGRDKGSSNLTKHLFFGRFQLSTSVLRSFRWGATTHKNSHKLAHPKGLTFSWKFLAPRTIIVSVGDYSNFFETFEFCLRIVNIL